MDINRIKSHPTQPGVIGTNLSIREGNARCGVDCYPAASESGWVVAVMVDTYGIPRVVDARGTSFGRQQIQRMPQPCVRPLTCGGRTCSAMAVAVVG